MNITSSAPGRINLFGEHQDYISFPIIAAAIDLKITIKGSVAEGNTIIINLPDINEEVAFSSDRVEYTRERDYLKSVVNLLKRKNLYRHRKIEATLRGTIPIKAGTSSSSALAVAWAAFLLQASGNFQQFADTPQEIGEIAYLAEVVEFGESGGRMDQYTSAFGGIVHIDFHGGMTVTPLPPVLTEFVLGDSQQPKDTLKTLTRIRKGYEQGFAEVKKLYPETDPFDLRYEDVSPHLKKIPSQYRPYLEAALLNHRITDRAKAEFEREDTDVLKIAELMNELHGVLRDKLNISTGKIEKMIGASLEAGAVSAKINGSGEGGCMFAFCPGKQEEVAEAIRREGGLPYIINIGKGVSVQTA